MSKFERSEVHVEFDAYEDGLSTIVPNVVQFVLDDLVVANSFKLTGNNTESLQEYVDQVAQPIDFNPELVTHIWSPGYQRQIPVIKDEDFIRIAVENEFATKSQSERVLKILIRDGTHPPEERIFNAIYQDYWMKNIVFLRADRLSELNRMLEDNKLFIKSIGAGAKKLLNDIETKLYQKLETSSSTSEE